MTPDSARARKPPGRAGRDLPAAIAVGVSLVVMVVVSLVFAKDIFIFVAALAMIGALWELSRALGQTGVWMPMPVMYAGAAAMVIGSYYGGPPLLIAAMTATVLLSVLWRMTRGQQGFVRDATATLFCLVYAPFLASFVSLLLQPDDGVARIVTFIAVVVFSDIGGYVAGVLFGKHPMAPLISPKKSWEGFAGSMVATTATSLACILVLLDGPWWVALILGPVVAMTATLGDLVESLIKRDVGIKDMSQILPGHGGLMDRLDSLLASVPIVWLVLFYLVPVA